MRGKTLPQTTHCTVLKHTLMKTFLTSSALSPVPRPQSPLPMPTPSDDIQQKNRQPIFADVETRWKMTFHLPTENPRATRRLRKPLSKTPLLFFHYENVFRKKGKTISIQTHPNLVISQHEHPIRKQLNQKGRNEHKEDKQSNASSLCPSCPSWLKNALVTFRQL